MEQLKEFWEDPKKRNFMIAIPAILVIYLVITFMSDKSQENLERIESRKPVVDESFQVFSTDSIDDLDAYQIEQMKKDLAQEADESNRAVKKERAEMEKKTDELLSQVIRSQQDVAKLSKTVQMLVKNGGQPNDKKNSNAGQQNSNNQQVQPQQVQIQPGNQQAVNRNQTTILTRNPTAIEGNAIRTVTQRQIRSVKNTGDVDIEERKNTKMSQAKDRAQKSAGRKKIQETLLAKEFFLPAGSIMSGTLLNGVDAPTSTASANDPMPILLRIKREAILPNHYSMDVRECHMLASAVGELSSERVRMRAEAISCVLNDGRAIEKNITAYAVSSYDGKVGIRGRLVSRNGQAIARAMMAGFISGMADASSPQKILSVDQAPGNSSLFQKADGEDILASGAFKGASGAMDRLASYYTQMAENMYPIIELSAGTQVDFIVQKGMSFKLEAQ